MTKTKVSERVTHLVLRAIRSSRFLAIALIAAFTSIAMQPAHAQSSDTWKSVAIIGGSTAAGAYIGHKVGGSTGALVGAGVGASVGYEIDSRRRSNQYYNQSSYGDGQYYPSNGGNYGNDGYYGNNGYSNGGAYPSGYRSSNYVSSSRFSNRH